MKKILTYLLVAMMFVSSFAACGSKNDGNEETSHLKKATEYIYAMYKDKGATTAMDFERTAQVIIGTTKFAVEWTTDNEAVKVTTNGTVATIDVAERSEAEVKYTLTATVKDAEGNTESVSFNYVVPKWEGFTKIVEEAYKLEAGAAMEGASTLEGTITKIDTAWSADYKNITVTIAVPGIEDKPIMCYRLTATNKDDAELIAQVAGLAVGDYITVTGTIKNYNGTIEFDAGCTLDALVKGEGSTAQDPVEEVPAVDPTGMSAAEILDAAYALEVGAAFGAPCTLTGVITEVNTPYSEQYGNITVTIVVDGKEDKKIECFRLVGDGNAELAVGDTITVTGTIKNYNGKIEFDAKCNLDAVVKGAEAPAPTEAPVEEPVAVDPTGMSAAEILDAAYALEVGAAFGAPCTLTGVITEVNTPYSEQYGNITVTIVVDGNEDKKIECFRLVGEGNAELAVGDTITVTGTIKNYNGKIEFDAKCNLDAVVKGAEAPATDWAFQYTGDYTAYTAVANADLANYANGVKVSFDFARIEDADHAWWNFTIINTVDGWPKFTDAKYYIGEAPAFSQYEFVDVNDKSVTNYSFTLSADAVAEAAAAGKDIAIQVFGIVPYNFKLEAVAGETPAVDYSAMTPAEILDAAYALAEGEAFTAPCTLTGVITEVNTPYSEQYGNITVTIVVDGNEEKKIECFRLVGDGNADLAVGDTITVTGTIKNYFGKIEFDAKCNLDAVVKAAGGDAPAASTATGIDLSAGLTAGTDYNGISVLEDMTWKEGSVEIDGVTYAGSVAGKNNPSPKNGEIPTEGAAVVVTPTANGTLTVIFKLNNGKTYHVICSDGTEIETGSNDSGESQYLTKTYTVEAGKTYYVYGDGTKLPFYFLGLN